MRAVVGAVVGAAFAWAFLAIWHGPTAWLFTRIEPETPADHVDRIRVWHVGREVAAAVWPSSTST